METKKKKRRPRVGTKGVKKEGGLIKTYLQRTQKTRKGQANKARQKTRAQKPKAPVTKKQPGPGDESIGDINAKTGSSKGQIKDSGKSPADERMPELPKSAYFDPKLGADACPWYDEYVKYACKREPRSYVRFHELFGLWIMSTIVARRKLLYFGHLRHLGLQFAVVAPSSAHTKSGAANVATAVLHDSHLEWLFLSGMYTPQRLIQKMNEPLPKNNLAVMVGGEQGDIAESLTGRRGLIFDEAGTFLNAMMKKGGYMADWRKILKETYDMKSDYESGTISRGDERWIKPYLPFVAILAVDNIRLHAHRGSELWGDGQFPRLLFSCPPEGEKISRARYPRKRLLGTPKKIKTPLKNWHNRLGVARSSVAVSDTSTVIDLREDPEPITLSDEAWDACYEYDDALKDMIENGDVPRDHHYSYTRFQEGALRVAGLFASMGNSETINMNHWTKARGIIENCRQSLHNLYEQVGQQPDGGENPKDIALREMVGRAFELAKKYSPSGITASQAYQRLKNSYVTPLDVSEVYEAMFSETVLNYKIGKGDVKKYYVPIGNDVDDFTEDNEVNSPGNLGDMQIPAPNVNLR